MVAVSVVRAKNEAVNLAGRTAIVVGATSGIGRGIALRLAKANVNVTVVGRNPQRGADVVQEMNKLGLKTASHRFVPSDAMLLSNVRQFSSDYSKSNPSLDYLVLTQGIATTQGRTPTKEGIDEKLSLHFYSRMAFIETMLPLLRESPDARVLSVLSGGVHKPFPKFREDPELKASYSISNAANAAGFYNDLMLDAYSKAEPGIAFTHAAPGVVSTNWGSQFPQPLRMMVRVLMPLLGKKADNCAEFMCEAIFDEDRKSGFHVMNQYGQPVGVTKLHHDDACEFIQAHFYEVLGRTHCQ